MGWSLDIVRPQLDNIFKNLEMRYEAQHPDAMSPRIHIIYERELPIATMRRIANLFPELVYIEFKQSTFPVESREVT